MPHPVAAAFRAQSMAEDAERHFAENPDRLWVPGATPAPSGMGLLPRNNNLGFRYVSIEEAFPAVAPGMRPVGSMVLVQIRQPLLRTQGGIVLDPETRKTELDNTQVGRVVAIGPLAFRNRQTYELWPEGAWFDVGQYVRVDKYDGDRFTRSYMREVQDEQGHRTQVEDSVYFVVTKDLAIKMVYDTAEDAMAERAFI